MSRPVLQLALELMCNAVCQNLNCQTFGYIERKQLAGSKYCQTVNCQTIDVSDCEIRLTT